MYNEDFKKIYPHKIGKFKSRFSYILLIIGLMFRK